jgi:hypothetical protein
MRDKIKAQIIATVAVVRSSGDLDKATPTESRTIPRLRVAEIDAACIALAIREFQCVPKRVGLMADLREKRGLPGGCRNALTAPPRVAEGGSRPMTTVPDVCSPRAASPRRLNQSACGAYSPAR